ncbi:MAG: hypothetical protein QW767_07130, partial [Thermoprotei archaeon]
AEFVVDASVARNLSNPSQPYAVLSEGTLSSYELWPVAATVTLTPSFNYLNGTVTFSGYAYYATGSDTGALPLSGAQVTFLVNSAQSAQSQTTRSGAYLFTWNPSGTGTYFVDVTVSASPSLAASSTQTEVVVSNLTVGGERGFDAQLYVNGTPELVPSGRSVLFALPAGSYTLSSPQYFYTNLTGVRQDFTGFTESGVNAAAPLTVNLQAPVKLGLGLQTQFLVSTVNPPGVAKREWVDAGSRLNLTEPNPINLTSDSRLAFAGWYINGVEPNSTVAATVNSPTTLVYSYVLQYLVTVRTQQGVQETWVDNGTQVRLNAPKYAGGVLGLELFDKWTGTNPSDSNTYTVTVLKPVTVQAVYTPLYAGLDALIVAALLLGLYFGRRMANPKKPQPSTQGAAEAAGSSTNSPQQVEGSSNTAS